MDDCRRFCDLDADKQNKTMQNDWRIMCRVDNIALFTFELFSCETTAIEIILPVLNTSREFAEAHIFQSNAILRK